MPRQPSILFVHDAFPAQFGAIGRWLTHRGWHVTFATAARPAVSDGLRLLHYAPHRAPTARTHPYAQPMERAAINGQSFARAALRLHAEGYRPDIVVAHSGPGGGMFAPDVFPDAAHVAYCEWWYRYPGADVAYLSDSSRAPSAEAAILERSRNAPIALDIASADVVLCPTRFQAAQFPEALRKSFVICHDGIDTARLAPGPALRRDTLGGLVAPDAAVVSYATRGMEPHRGFPQFMAALPQVLAENPRAVAVIAGENRVAYGGTGLRRVDWKARALAEHDIDPARVHFVGKLGPADYLGLLQRSDAHVYLTVPFVLSWSMLEAMSVGCALVLSDTAPVLEFADTECATLVDMRQQEQIAQGILATLAGGAATDRRRLRARETVLQTLSQDICFGVKHDLFRTLLQT